MLTAKTPLCFWVLPVSCFNVDQRICLVTSLFLDSIYHLPLSYDGDLESHLPVYVTKIFLLYVFYYSLFLQKNYRFHDSFFCNYYFG